MEETVVQSATFGFVLSALFCGGLVGFILQRGRFCMNSAFRDTIFIQDFTLFRAYLIALAVIIVGSNFLNDLGFMELKSQTFFPLANIIGGYLFGIGMVLASGCGSGIWYKGGEGQLAAAIGVMGFFLGIGATNYGILNPLYNALRSIKFEIAGKPNAMLWEVFGDTLTAKWAVIAVIAVLLLIATLKDKPFSLGKQKGFYWSVTGLLLGLAGVLTFWASQYWGGGFARGMNFTTPTGELFFTILTGDGKSRFFPMFDMFGFKTTWGAFFIAGVPLGAYISAKVLKEFKWTLPSAGEMLTVLGGSVLMGFAATVAGGCNIGQGLTGAATLSIGSISAIISIILGNWTMVYFRFIKPMQD
ncbi:MAG: YeeE/YedE family protein [Alphaproteobacteria bacterium]|uniref:YeeE/YedE family protein n=1 Tax=Candidatus Nitrobium versatile TaxID=2884831 RepID=A0A953M2Z9_9BACT|nr:YeeE/YedE family protein [Candidatus Nitrobium versatile]